MSIGHTEKSYPASVVQKAVQYSRESRDNHTELERIMDLLMDLQPWQVLVHASEICNEHVGKRVKIVNGRAGVLSDFEVADRNPHEFVLLIVDGKIARVRRWDDVIVYMSED